MKHNYAIARTGDARSPWGVYRQSHLSKSPIWERVHTATNSMKCKDWLNTADYRALPCSDLRDHFRKGTVRYGDTVLFFRNYAGPIILDGTKLPERFKLVAISTGLAMARVS